MKPCKHLDYNLDNYSGCELKTCAPHYPDVKYWEREAPYDGAPTKVQFCGEGRGRINSVFDCYNGEMSCYTPDND
jgi:hypothetical protein